MNTVNGLSFCAVLVAALGVAACHAQPSAPPVTAQPTLAPSASASATPTSTPAVTGFRCNLLLGVAVTSEWFEAGFERIVDDARWEAILKPHTSLTEWGDASDPVWALAPSSACAEQPNAPDRVLLTVMKWEYKTADEWHAGLNAAVRAIQAHFPSAQQIVLLTMIRAPHNVSCGNAMSVVEPFVDEAVARAAREQPELVCAGPQLEALSCELFKNGGPHFSDAGRLEIAKVVGTYYAHEP